MPRPVGTWRSLVAYLNGVQGVPGSNPGVPTKLNPPTLTYLSPGVSLRLLRSFIVVLHRSQTKIC